MTAIPRAALALGLAGLIPFLCSAVTHLSVPLASWAGGRMLPMFIGGYVGLTYGSIILSFMSGVLWGFATKAVPDRAGAFYALSVIPALWVFLMVTDASPDARVYLIAGFAGLLGLDWTFWKQGLAPDWWMRLRTVLTSVVIACLAVPLIL
jgi:Protein of unknown function (DUF3429)